jgi:hypothetical protein
VGRLNQNRRISAIDDLFTASDAAGPIHPPTVQPKKKTLCA